MGHTKNIISHTNQYGYIALGCLGYTFHKPSAALMGGMGSTSLCCLVTSNVPFVAKGGEYIRHHGCIYSSIVLKQLLWGLRGAFSD